MDQQTAFLAVFCSALQHRPLPDIPEEYWANMLDMADRQHLYALIGEKLAEMPAFCASEQYEQVLRKSVRHTLEQEKRKVQFLALYRALKDKGLHPLVMKGMVCRAAYGSLGRLRPSGDEDLMIPPDEFRSAWQVLEANGYHAAAKAKPTCVEQIHHVLFRNDNGCIIELHIHPIGLETSHFAQMDRCFDDAHSRKITMTWKGESFYTLCPTDHYLLLIFHMVKHFYSLGFGIRPLADMAVYYTRCANEIMLDEVYAALDACGLMPLYRDLVYIANHHLGFCLPASGETVCPDELLAHMLEGGVLGKRDATTLVSSLMVRSSIANEHHPIKMLWRMVFPSRESVLRIHPDYASKPWKWLLHYPRRWFRGIRTMLRGTTPARSMKSSQQRLHLLQRYGIG